MVKVKQSKYNGFDSYILTNGHVQVVIVPDLGGKFVSIQDLSTGREWLSTNPHLPQRQVEYDASFVKKYDTGGLDECFPAVSGGEYPIEPWEGIMIPDHGELWCQAWEAAVEEESARRAILAMRCHGVRFPYRFERTLTISTESPAITLDYKVTNVSNFDFPFVWSIHPIIKIEEGMRVVLPEGVDSVRVDMALNDFLGTGGSICAWPQAKRAGGQPIDLSCVPAPDFGQAYKLYTKPLQGEEPVSTAIIDPSGSHALTFRFRPDEISHVGLWMNYGGWSGIDSKPYFNLGLEPCIGGTDALPDAIKLNEYAVLPGKQTRKWNLELLVT